MQENNFIIPKNSATKIKIENNNWFKEFPYSPVVSAALWHNSKSLFIEFEVKEYATMANVTEDNGEVWTDSCVEFFISFDDTGYYNFEFSCIGKLLLAFRKEKPNPTYANSEVLSRIKRCSTLGNQPFSEQISKTPQLWKMSVEIPIEAFFKHNFSSFDGLKASANLYKCGDNLAAPHFLSWNPIDTPTPNFHKPEFFAKIEFES